MTKQIVSRLERANPFNVRIAPRISHRAGYTISKSYAKIGNADITPPSLPLIKGRCGGVGIEMGGGR